MVIFRRTTPVFPVGHDKEFYSALRKKEKEAQDCYSQAQEEAAEEPAQEEIASRVSWQSAWKAAGTPAVFICREPMLPSSDRKTACLDMLS
ncbi:hypothetical protein [Parasphaerochaeta coccoides]|uniref:hypothetical protein n=1 Tax=Parasphaerochaeta coccoides TaxID=273376 RepID=UPI00145EC119|nr:hypothetical protein [Parasphaerochaeta coccoides]